MPADRVLHYMSLCVGEMGERERERHNMEQSKEGEIGNRKEGRQAYFVVINPSLVPAKSVTVEDCDVGTRTLRGNIETQVFFKL